MKYKAFLVLVMAVFFVACSQNEAPSSNNSQLSDKNYKIANSDDLAKAISLPTTSNVGKGINLTINKSSSDILIKPSDVNFNSDGTFKLSYDDGSYLVGLWKVIEPQLQLTFGGYSAMFDMKFPDAKSIELWIKKETIATVEPTEPLQPATESSESTQTGGLITSAEEVLFPKLQGTWCYVSGYDGQESQWMAVESLIMDENKKIFVRLFWNLKVVIHSESGEDYFSNKYEEAQVDDIGNYGSNFSLTFYRPQEGYMPQFTIKDDGTMTVAYAPLKKALLQRVSTNEAACGGKPTTATSATTTAK